MIKKLGLIYQYFTSIFLLSLLDFMIIDLAQGARGIYYTSLLKLALIALLCALSCLIFPEHAVSKRECSIRIAIHFATIQAIVLTGGWLLDWYAGGLRVFSLFLQVSVIYGIMSLYFWGRAKREADALNQQLEKRFSDEGRVS